MDHRLKVSECYGKASDLYQKTELGRCQILLTLHVTIDSMKIECENVEDTGVDATLTFKEVLERVCQVSPVGLFLSITVCLGSMNQSQKCIA